MLLGTSAPFDRVSFRNALSDLRVVWPTPPVVWEMGIPRFADYVLRRNS